MGEWEKSKSNFSSSARCVSALVWVWSHFVIRFTFFSPALETVRQSTCAHIAIIEIVVNAEDYTFSSCDMNVHHSVWMQKKWRKKSETRSKLSFRPSIIWVEIFSSSSSSLYFVTVLVAFQWLVFCPMIFSFVSLLKLKRVHSILRYLILRSDAKKTISYLNSTPKKSWFRKRE